MRIKVIRKINVEFIQMDYFNTTTLCLTIKMSFVAESLNL